MMAYVDAGTSTVAIDVDTVDGEHGLVRWASERGEQVDRRQSAEKLCKALNGWAST